MNREARYPLLDCSDLLILTQNHDLFLGHWVQISNCQLHTNVAIICIKPFPWGFYWLILLDVVGWYRRFLHVVGQDGQICQHVQINHWPLFNVKRLKDGRWRLENYYAYYVSKPDNPTFAYAPSGLQEKKVLCNMCTPPTYGLIWEGKKKPTSDAHVILCPQKKSWFLRTGIHLSKFKNKQMICM
jgi:hypothetical protein